ncbi:hypothetical protein VP01_1356g6 [Puccinia sorghi]|uniref:LSM2-LSM8 complex subunit LSM8 n=1 Tax=Puccinia sorghi TaxID=27349 RepID=A0A0L6VM58_9BASI|nr:hypothetical protein VP01_1356g6 [Puccinia sorghi]
MTRLKLSSPVFLELQNSRLPRWSNIAAPSVAFFLDPASEISLRQDKRVLVITQDGRTITGELKGFDQTTNIILSDSIERVFSSDEPMEEVPLGLYIVRGDHISVIGELDVDADTKIDWPSIRAEPLDEIRH